MNRPNKEDNKSEKKWIITHIFIPLLPFIVGSGIHFIITFPIITWNTFNFSDLSLTMVFVSAFVRESILNNKPLLNNLDKEEEVDQAANNWWWPILISFLFFGLLEYANTEWSESKVKSDISLRILQIVSLLFSLCISYMSRKAQQSFKLKARFL